jgi:hypothetical protein
MGMPERHDVVVATEHVRKSTLDVLERKAFIREDDLRGVAGRLPEDELYRVVPKRGGKGAAGGR